MRVAVARHLHETDFQVRVLQIIESTQSSPCFTNTVQSVFYNMPFDATIHSRPTIFASQAY